MIDRLRRPLDAAALVAFRVVFGLMVSVSASRFLYHGWVDELFVRPRFYFSYLGWSWVKPLPAAGMHAVFWGLVALGGLIAAGLFYRVAIVLFFVTFTYVQLIDVSNYLNHYYLVSLLALLMCTMPLERAWSLDALRRPSIASAHLPAWCTYLLRFQVGTVYFFAGLAKLQPDWLAHAQPLGIWLSARSGMPLVGPLLGRPETAFVMSWAGLLFDTTIPLWLSWRRTRPVAYLAVLGFHAATSMLFPIGMFPVIMVVSALVFFDADWPRALLSRSRWAAPAPPTPTAPASPLGSARGPREVAALALAGAWCVAHVLMPLRCHLYGGDVLWHEQGMRWSWRVMVREKNASVTYLVEDGATGRVREVSPRRYLTDRQEREFSTQPDLVLALAHRVARDARLGGMVDPMVRVHAVASLNGRPGAPLIDPSIDLARVEDGLGKYDWVTTSPTQQPPHLKPPPETCEPRRVGSLL